MCGICGQLLYDKVPVDEALLKRMCAAFSYRGPDDQGIYAATVPGAEGRSLSVGLGHDRLSIIDLSGAGHQPMGNETGNVWVTYNGEIYNHAKLRAELTDKGHVFRSRTDTEVILHAYEQEGVEAVHRFDGMFAFALWDQERARLWACRDRLGIKPLVYYWDGTRFAFASEIKALLCDPEIPREIDEEALMLYLAFNYIPAPYTIFKAIRKLEPGCQIVVQDARLQTQPYWDIPQFEDGELWRSAAAPDERHLAERLEALLSAAVEKRLIADVPLGAFLSGGIDSSIVVALMARHSLAPVKTFSIGYRDDALFDETRYARQVARLYKTDHHEFKLTFADMLEVLTDVLDAFDEPFADSSAIPTYIVSRETRRYVTVALSGDGGDELFAGYRSYLAEYWRPWYVLLPAFLRERVVERILEGLPDSRDTRVTEYIRRGKKFVRGTRGSFEQRLLSLKEVFPLEVRNLLLRHDAQTTASPCSRDLALDWVRTKLARYRADPINRMLHADVKDSLPGDMLNKVDWMSMKNSLEVRVPFLDHRVVEFAFRIHGALKLRRGRTKSVLKRTFRHLLPPELYNRAKAGFEVPISRWLKTDLRFLLDRYLARERITDQGIFQYETVAELVRLCLSGRTDTSWMLWNLIVFQFWHEKYGP